MNNKRTGLYLGLSSVGGVVVEKGKVVASSNFDLSSVETETVVDNLDDRVKYEALVNRVLKEMGGEEKEIYISVADRDFIFRSLELPFMKGRKEIESSLTFEIEKHIPFKLEELRWDYDYTASSRDKKVNLSFVGMKTDSFNKTQEVVTYLGFSPRVIEPSSISLVRILKRSKKFAHFENFVLLDFTLSEAYLTFFYQNLPIFSNYLEVPQEEGNIRLDKFIDLINLSFQYFQKEHKFFIPQKILAIGNFIEDSFEAALSKDLQREVEVVHPKYVEENVPSFVENLKALGVTERETSSYRFNPVLLSSGERAKQVQVPVKEEAAEVIPLKTKLLASLALAGLIISIATVMLTYGRYSALSSRLKKEEQRLALPASYKNLSLAQIDDVLEKRQEAINSLRRTLARPRTVASFLKRIGFVIPQGVWLEKLEVALRQEKYQGKLAGYSYGEDSYKERLKLDEFISNLQRDEILKSLFSDVRVISSGRKRIKEFEVTAFTLELE
ncbi:MAG: pilus assembly protein PilM [Candidatus Omnitrophota bacterium]|nr:MAG: pilus assembly protein PilM [Candidatus Omnitrophota bacterium]